MNLTYASLVAINNRRDHIIWIVLQNIAARGFTALKIFIIARLLGPDAIGVIGVLLLTIAIVESLSDLGINQAIIQHRTPLGDEELQIAWTAIFLRGLVLGALLIITATYFAELFKADQASGMLRWFGAILIFKNSISVGYTLAVRDRDFKRTGLFQVGIVTVDLVLSVLLVFFQMNVWGFVWGLLIAEFIRFIVSYILFPYRPRLSFDLRKIPEITGYGKWVWGSSALTLVLNQMDKLLVVRLLGTTQFGIYQIAAKIAQLFIADIALLIGNYLFPTFAKEQRSESSNINKKFLKIFILITSLSLGTSIYIGIFAPWIISTLLGAQWLDAVPVLRILLVSMAFGASISVLVSFLNGIGWPKIVTQSTILQLIIYIPLLFICIKVGGLKGVAVALTLSTLTTVLYMSFYTINKNNLMIPWKLLVKTAMIPFLFLVGISILPIGIPVAFISTAAYFFFVLSHKRLWRVL